MIQAGLQSAQSSCLSLLNSRITGLGHHAPPASSPVNVVGQKDFGPMKTGPVCSDSFLLFLCIPASWAWGGTPWSETLVTCHQIKVSRALLAASSWPERQGKVRRVIFQFLPGFGKKHSGFWDSPSGRILYLQLALGEKEA